MLPVLLWLWQRESVTWFRWLLLTSFVVSLLVFVPTPCFLAPTEPLRFRTLNLLQRVVPVVVAFCCLTVYGLAFTWLARRRPKLITAPMRDQLWPTLRLGGTLGILLGSVFAAAYSTVPIRLLNLPNWTDRDFREHYEDTIAQLQRALAQVPTSVEARSNMGFALAAEGRFAAAIAQFQQALEIEPDNVAAQKNLAWLLATCPAASLRNGVEAIEHARRANRLCGGERPDILDTLAAAYAEAGRFPEALATARNALELATRKTIAFWQMVCGRGWQGTEPESPIISRCRLPHRRNLDRLHQARSKQGVCWRLSRHSAYHGPQGPGDLLTLTAILRQSDLDTNGVLWDEHLLCRPPSRVR